MFLKQGDLGAKERKQNSGTFQGLKMKGCLTKKIPL